MMKRAKIVIENNKLGIRVELDDNWDLKEESNLKKLKKPRHDEMVYTDLLGEEICEGDALYYDDGVRSGIGTIVRDEYDWYFIPQETTGSNDILGYGGWVQLHLIEDSKDQLKEFYILKK